MGRRRTETAARSSWWGVARRTRRPPWWEGELPLSDPKTTKNSSARIPKNILDLCLRAADTIQLKYLSPRERADRPNGSQ